jgi:ABC-2 type transport system permease protein
MRYLQLTAAFARASTQQELAYRANFLTGILHALLNLATGVLALHILFSQIESVQGWTFGATLALLGVYLSLQALRDLVIGPSLEALAGLNGAIWQGTFDFTLLRPLPTQFLVSVQQWRPLALFDLSLAVGVLAVALLHLQQTLSFSQGLAFIATLAGAVTILYSLLLALTSCLFWGPGFLYTWLFNGIFQMARYPVGIYPGWLRLVLTWILPVGIMTTIPAQALAGTLSPVMLAASLALALLCFAGASRLFAAALRRYSSASS